MLKGLYNLGISFSIKVFQLDEPTKEGYETGVLLTFEKGGKSIETFETIMDIGVIENCGGMEGFLQIYFGHSLSEIEDMFKHHDIHFPKQ